MANTSRSGTKRTAWVWIILGVIVVAFALIFSLIPPSNSDSAPSQDTSQEREAVEEEEIELPDFSRRVADDPTALGEVDAPVTIVEYADYRCPYCGVFSRDTLPQLVDEYVDEGLVRVEWRDVPIFGEESFAAAVAARAAGEQGMYWEYHSAIFEGADTSGHQALPTDKLLTLAADIGVPDLDQFEADLEKPELHEAVAEDMQEAQHIGIQSTPVFLVGSTPLMGSQPIEEYRNAIDAQLEKAGN